MRIFSVVVASLCLAATIGVSAAHADDDGWRRHEWREHHWRGEHRYRHHSTEPRLLRTPAGLLRAAPEGIRLRHRS